MIGLAEYVPFSTCPYPQEVATWESIPPAQIASFVPPDFSTAQCFTGLGDYIGWDSCESPGAVGLGALSLTAPDGYFSTGDFTQWGAYEWGTVLAGAYFLLSLWGDTKRAGRRVTTRARKIKRGFAN
jgi:hypothetical protein